MEENKNVANLQKLKENYDEGVVSALIGAGSSKNVSNSFMDWDTLLQDLIDDLFKLEIDQVVS